MCCSDVGELSGVILRALPRFLCHACTPRTAHTPHFGNHPLPGFGRTHREDTLLLSSDPETTVDIVDTAPASDTAFETEFGPPARTLDQFAEVIDPGRALTETERENLFSCSAGRVRIARALLGAAERAGIRLSDIDAPRVDALLPPELSPHRKGDAELSADIYLLLLFSSPRRITSTTVDLIRSTHTLAEADAAADPGADAPGRDSFRASPVARARRGARPPRRLDASPARHRGGRPDYSGS